MASLYTLKKTQTLRKIHWSCLPWNLLPCFPACCSPSLITLAPLSSQNTPSPFCPQRACLTACDSHVSSTVTSSKRPCFPVQSVPSISHHAIFIFSVAPMALCFLVYCFSALEYHLVCEQKPIPPCSKLFLQCLAYCLAHSRHSKNICCMGG